MLSWYGILWMHMLNIGVVMYGNVRGREKKIFRPYNSFWLSLCCNGSIGILLEFLFGVEKYIHFMVNVCTYVIGISEKAYYLPSRSLYNPIMSLSITFVPFHLSSLWTLPTCRNTHQLLKLSSLTFIFIH